MTSLRALVGSLVLASAAAAQLPPPASSRATPLAPFVPFVDPKDSAFGLPTGFADEVVLHDLDQAIGLTFAPGGPMYVWLKAGVVLVFEETPAGWEQAAQPLLDISDLVDNHGDFGLMAVALDPQFASNGWLYVFYDVDHYALFHAGLPGYDPGASELNLDTIARITRYTADASTGFTTLVPGSELVLLGTGPGDGPLVSGKAHGAGSLLFGADGTLLVSMGDSAATPGAGNALADGLILPKDNVGPWRSQLVDSLGGKILRLDPATGDGVPSNPWFDAGAPRAPRSRVWTVGLRNPCRFALRPGTGSVLPGDGDPGVLLIGDVGAERIEELSIVDAPGLNLGWPVKEGFSPSPVGGTVPGNQDAPNPNAGQPGCNLPFFTFAHLFQEDSANPPFWPDPCHPGQPIPTSAPHFVHRRPALDWDHDDPIARAPAFDGNGAAVAITLEQPGCPVAGATFAGNCSMGGAFAGAADWPDPWRDAYYHADYGLGWLRRMDLSPDSQLLGVELFAQPVGKVVWVTSRPDDGTLWYIDYGSQGDAHVHRIAFYGDNLPPTAAAAATPAWGPLPLSVSFDSSGSQDPEGLALATRWDFSDGTPFSLLASPVRELPCEDITALGTPHAQVLNLNPPGSTGFSNHDIGVIRDGVRPVQGTTDDQLQYDTIHVNGLGVPDKGPMDWIGYTFPETHTFTGLLYEEGMNYQGGGWFSQLSLQVHTAAGWSAVENLVSTPTYPGSTTVNYETFEFRFTPVAGDGLRLFGKPGGISPLKFVTIAELRVLARPLAPAPTGVTATLTVTDPSGESDVDETVVAAGDAGPPQILKLLPLTGGAYSASAPTQYELSVKAADPDDAASALEGSWQVILHHDNHTHPEPVVPGLQQTIVIEPEGRCGNGDVFWVELRCVVRDPLGLSTAGSVFLVPECDRNQNGIDDRVEIASGEALDHDKDGVIDVCENDCDGDGVPDFAAIHFGLATDGNEDGVPDGCNPKVSTGKQKQAPSGPPK